MLVTIFFFNKYFITLGADSGSFYPRDLHSFEYIILKGLLGEAGSWQVHPGEHKSSMWWPVTGQQETQRQDLKLWKGSWVS